MSNKINRKKNLGHEIHMKYKSRMYNLNKTEIEQPRLYIYVNNVRRLKSRLKIICRTDSKQY